MLYLDVCPIAETLPLVGQTHQVVLWRQSHLMAIGMEKMNEHNDTP